MKKTNNVWKIYTRTIVMFLMLSLISFSVCVEASAKGKTNTQGKKKQKIVSMPSITLCVGQTKDVAKKLPKSIQKKVRWTVSNRKVLCEKKKGRFLAKKTGKTLLEARYGRKVYRFSIKIKEKEPKKTAKVNLLTSGTSYQKHVGGAKTATKQKTAKSSQKQMAAKGKKEKDKSGRQSKQQEKSLKEVAKEKKCHPGMLGRLTIPDVGVDVALYKSSCHDKKNQKIVDAKDSAAWMPYGKQVLIADHVYQGFSTIKKAVPGKTKAYINDGSKIRVYTCTACDVGINKQSDMRDRYGNSILQSDKERLCIYTCNVSCINEWNITYTYWK